MAAISLSLQTHTEPSLLEPIMQQQQQQQQQQRSPKKAKRPHDGGDDEEKVKHKKAVVYREEKEERCPSKVVFILIDGIGDTSYPLEFYHSSNAPSKDSNKDSNKKNKTTKDQERKTPLQFAKTPNFDLLAKSGLNGLLDPVEPGLACGSDTAHMSLLGYLPQTYYRGRGAFESMGAGLEMKPGDIAFKSNFATLDRSTNTVVRRRADRLFHEWGPMLCDSLRNVKLPSFPEIEVEVRYATEHRCGVRLRGPDLTDTISGTDPLKDNLPLRECVPILQTPQAVRTCKIVNEVSQAFQDVLVSHELTRSRAEKNLPIANVVLLRGAGTRIKVKSFQELHGMRAFAIAPTAIIAGVAITLGIDVVKAPGGTGDYRTDFSSKAHTCVKNITNNAYDFGFLHIKAVDDAGHDKDLHKKVEFLEKADAMLGLVATELKKSSEDFTIVLTGDHTTPIWVGDHSNHPVPFAIARLRHFSQQQRQQQPHSPSKKQAKHKLDEEKKVTDEFQMFVQSDKVEKFDEISAAKGLLGRFPGREVMPLIENFRK